MRMPKNAIVEIYTSSSLAVFEGKVTAWDILGVLVLRDGERIFFPWTSVDRVVLRDKLQPLPPPPVE